MSGASFKEENLIIIEDTLEFSRRVGIIRWAKDIEPLLDFEVGTTAALFGPGKVKTLKEFCAKNPDYHIVSVVGDYIYRNKYVEGCEVYMLANGDANSNLLDHPYYNSSLALYHEELHQKLTAKFAEIKGSPDKIFLL